MEKMLLKLMLVLCVLGEGEGRKCGECVCIEEMLKCRGRAGANIPDLGEVGRATMIRRMDLRHSLVRCSGLITAIRNFPVIDSVNIKYTPLLSCHCIDSIATPINIISDCPTKTTTTPTVPTLRTRRIPKFNMRTTENTPEDDTTTDVGNDSLTPITPPKTRQDSSTIILTITDSSSSSSPTTSNPGIYAGAVSGLLAIIAVAIFCLFKCRDRARRCMRRCLPKERTSPPPSPRLFQLCPTNEDVDHLSEQLSMCSLESMELFNRDKSD